MSPNRTVVSRDHLDLLVTAAHEYGLLVDATTAAFSPAAGEAGTIATSAAVGQLLLEENVAAVRWQADRGCGKVRLGLDQINYEHLPVDHVDPVEVIKAAHCYQQLAEASPGWAGSAARRLIVATIHFATERLPGYAQAPWHWTRPQPRTGPVIGLRAERFPDVEGVRWVTPTQLQAGWEAAALVLITTEALADVPDGLPPRPGIYVCAGRILDEDHWRRIVDLRPRPDQVVMLPAGLPWLLEQLRDSQAAAWQSRPALALPATAGRRGPT